MSDRTEYPTFREWLGGADEMTDAELEQYRQASFTGALYDLMKAVDELIRVAVMQPLLVFIKGVGRAIGGKRQ